MTEEQKISIDLALQIKINRKSLEKDFANNFNVQRKTLAIIVGALEYANFNEFTTASIIWNVAGYLNLVSFDLKIIARDLMFEEEDYQRKLYARQAYLIVYESMNGFLELLGKPLRDAITADFSDSDVCI